VSRHSEGQRKGRGTHAGETKDDEALVVVLLVKLLEAAVLAGKAAVAGRVDDEDRLRASKGDGGPVVDDKGGGRASVNVELDASGRRPLLSCDVPCRGAPKSRASCP
jgi:hypothetical protein